MMRRTMFVTDDAGLLLKPLELGETERISDGLVRSGCGLCRVDLISRDDDGRRDRSFFIAVGSQTWRVEVIGEVVAEISVEKAAQVVADDHIRNGATAPWGNGAVLYEFGEDILGREMDEEERAEYVRAFVRYFNANAPQKEVES